MKKAIKYIFILFVLLLIGIQFVPVQRTNPPVQGDLSAPPEIKAILKNACYDCHSHETVWPWYSRVAPVSWMVADDVKTGRRFMNFSIWNTYNPGKQAVLLSGAVDQIGEGDMPLLPYKWMHPAARLTPEHIQAVTNWMVSASGT